MKRGKGKKGGKKMLHAPTLHLFFHTFILNQRLLLPLPFPLVCLLFPLD